MDNNASAEKTSDVPKIVVTEPSPIPAQSTSAVSVVRKIEAIPEVSTNGAGIIPDPVQVSTEPAAATSVPSTNHESGEFVPAQACNDCVVPVIEEFLSQSVEGAQTTTASEPDDQNDLRIPDEGCCAIYCTKFINRYRKAWKVVNSYYALPLWILSIVVPFFSGMMGSVNMYRCPASPNLPLLVFSIGVSLMILISLRICIIIRRMTTSAEDEWRKILQSFLGIATFLTVVFFAGESVTYWQMHPTPEYEKHNYCDRSFQSFLLWWNCLMSVFIWPIIFFPA